MQFKKSTLALLIAGLFSTPAVHAQAAGNASEVGTISIVGEGDKLGNGLIVQEDSAKARSSISRAAIDKERATSNPFQLIELLPGVNSWGHDATGLFGGGFTIRGFNSDQIGLTINGAPVNDSGNFAVYPQEYVDQENLCEVFVTQGSTDTDAPHVGASGGNLGIVSCDPSDERKLTATQTLGGNSLTRSFVRYNTGKLLDERFKAYLSYSKSKADKWKGYGGADRQHIDARAMLNLSPGNSLAFTALYNKAVTNNFKSVTKSQYDAFGRNFDFLGSFAGNPAPVNGTAQTAVYSGAFNAAPVTPLNNAYYGFSLNPFKNSIYTLDGNFKLASNLNLQVSPYYWYGYGTGGTEQNVLSESGFLGNGATTGKADINGDGDTLDKVIVYKGSLTETKRPGITAKATWQLGNHKLVFGYWVERARHRQTQPATRVGNDGSIASLWLDSNLIQRADGSLYQGRDQMTVSKAQQIFVQDSIGLMNDRLSLQLGVRNPKIDRDFTNYANEGTPVDYHIDKTYSQVLPSFGVRYQLSDTRQVFANIAKNMRAPANYALAPVKVNGVWVASGVKAETSTNLDLGYRYQGQALTFSGSVFHIDFKDRLASAYDATAGVSWQANTGSVKTQGFELELGSQPVHGWSAYTSLTYTDSKLNDDFKTATTTSQPTAGKVFPNTPRLMLGASLQYAAGPFSAQLRGKHTGKVYSTLTNDESIAGHTAFDLDLGYRLAGTALIKNPTLRLNVSNLFNSNYLMLNGGSGDSITTNATGAGARSPSYYVSAPRFLSVSLGADF